MIPRIVWLASYPKSGNTWVRVFLSSLMQDAHRHLDINNLLINGISSDRRLFDKVLGCDTGDLTPNECKRLRPVAYRWINTQLEEPTYYKVHDCCEQLANGDWLMAPEATSKVIYILRNPLDVVVSMAYVNQRTFDETIALLGDADTHIAPRKPNKQVVQLEQKLGTWSQHVHSWTTNALFQTLTMRYEDLLNAPQESFTAIAAFLNIAHDSERIAQAIQNTSFETLQTQENEAEFREKPQKADRFFRSGKIGDWQEKLSGSQIERILNDHGSVMQKFGYAKGDGTPQLC